MFGEEGGKRWNAQPELKFCHSMCLIRKGFSPGQIRKRKILKNWPILMPVSDQDGCGIQ